MAEAREKPPSAGPPETSLKESLQAIFDNEELCDMYLRSSDGILVPALGGLLSARSPVFREMLAEQNNKTVTPNNDGETKPVVDINYKGDVLREIVEYISTDRSSILEIYEYRESDVATIVSLAAAGIYFVLPKLCQKAEKRAALMMKTKPLLAVEFLARCALHDTGVTGIEEASLSVIRIEPEVLSEPGSKVGMLQSIQLDRILKDDALKAKAQAQFMALQKWVNSVQEAPNGGGTRAALDVSRRDMRRKIALKLLTDHINLSMIDPMELRTTVKESGLASLSQLLKAYESQALTAKKSYGFPFVKQVVWKTSNDVTVDGLSDRRSELLACPPLKKGIHAWGMKIEDMDKQNYVGLGVVLTRNDGDYSFGDGHWCYYSDGESFRHGDQIVSTNLMQYGKGSYVRFVLDLTGDGMLSAAVDGNPSFLLFSDMMINGHGDRDTDRSFVPYARLMKGHRIRFLGFD